MARPAKLQLVQPKLSEDEAISIIRTGNFGEAQLIRGTGLSRARVRKLIALHAPTNRIRLPSRKALNPVQLPVAMPEPAAENAPAATVAPPKPLPRPIVKWLIGGGCFLIALGLGAVNAVMNYRFGMSFGQDDVSRTALGAATFLVDAGALLLFAAAGYLWEDSRYLLCLVTFLGWGVCMGLSASAALGFAAGNIGDTLQARASIMNHRKVLDGELARAQDELAAIREKRDPQIIEQQIQIERGAVPQNNLKWSKDCTDVTRSGAECLRLNQERGAKIAAEQRVYLGAKINTLSEAVALLPPVSAKDPPAEQLSQIASGLVTPEQVRSYLVRCLALIISMSPGILLAIARTLLR